MSFCVLLLLCIQNLYADITEGMPNPPSNPTIVRVGAFVSDILDIDELNEGAQVDIILQYKWHDSRLSFDPKKAGKKYKLFQGAFQFNEVYSGWWPQVSILNEVGTPDVKAVQIKVWYNGDVTMREQRTLNVETPMKLGKFPFDRQKLSIYMVPFGNDASEVVLKADPDSRVAIHDYIKNNPDVNIAEWSLVDYSLTEKTPTEDYYGAPAKYSKLILQLVLDRKPTNIIWKLLIPLSLLVLGMWAIFWMDKEALSDRLNVAFIGILSVIAYQFLIEGEMPRIDYFTFTDSFLLISFAILFSTVLESLAVYWCMRKAYQKRAWLLDIAFRVLFPVGYILMILFAYIFYI